LAISFWLLVFLIHVDLRVSGTNPWVHLPNYQFTQLPNLFYPSPCRSDDYILDEGKSFCYYCLMLEINITVSWVYGHPVARFYPSTSAKAHLLALAPVCALGFAAMGSLLSLEAF
jgi:hypothetical protein